MNNVSIESIADGEGTKRLEEAARKNGFALGTLSVTIHEEHDARDSRDAAIDAAGSAIKVAEQMRSVEDKLRKKLESAEAAFQKERQEHVEAKLAHAREVAMLKGALEEALKKIGEDAKAKAKKLEKRAKK